MNRKENFTAGFIRENPVFSLYLGLCSTLAITTTLNLSLIHICLVLPFPDSAGCDLQQSRLCLSVFLLLLCQFRGGSLPPYVPADL